MFKIISLVAYLLIASFAEASVITAVKGDRVLIEQDMDGVQLNDLYYAINDDGKKLAIIKILQIKNNKAVGQVTKGKAAKDLILIAKNEQSEIRQKNSNFGVSGKSADYIGVTLGYLMNSMDAAFTYGNPLAPTQVSTSMTGTGYSLGAYYDWGVSNEFIARLQAIWDQFDVRQTLSSNQCGQGTTTNCAVTVDYLNLGATVRYIFWNRKSMRFGAGGGFAAVVPMQKASTALNESAISLGYISILQATAEFRINVKFWIPVSIEYNLFGKSGGVSANYIAIRAGYARPF